MSEYQYYEFQAVDKPLDERAMAALRAISSRAEITPTSLVNVYHFGSFKGNPNHLMDQYFDAFLYVANWGTHRLMLRLPSRLFDLTAVEPYCVPTILQAPDTTWLFTVRIVSSRTAYRPSCRHGLPRSMSFSTSVLRRKEGATGRTKTAGWPL